VYAIVTVGDYCWLERKGFGLPQLLPEKWASTVLESRKDNVHWKRAWEYFPADIITVP